MRAQALGPDWGELTPLPHGVGDWGAVLPHPLSLLGRVRGGQPVRRVPRATVDRYIQYRNAPHPNFFSSFFPPKTEMAASIQENKPKGTNQDLLYISVCLFVALLNLKAIYTIYAEHVHTVMSCCPH